MQFEWGLRSVLEHWEGKVLGREGSRWKAIFVSFLLVIDVLNLNACAFLAFDNIHAFYTLYRLYFKPKNAIM